VWSLRSRRDARGRYYRYLVDVFVPGVGIVRNRVTDPYSLSLSADSQRSYVADLDDPALAPPGWRRRRAALAAPTDMVVYELHVRDFSASDDSVPAAHRGKYLAFTDTRSHGMRHLRALAEAGLTDVHLLPVFDLASVPERGCVTPRSPPARGDDEARRRRWRRCGARLLQLGLRPLPLQRARRQLRQRRRRRRRAHPRVPRDGAGAARGRPARGHGRGLQPHQRLRPGPRSVLDRIVPGYYHRLDAKARSSTPPAARTPPPRTR
jgi:hypothetical protein